MWDVASMGAVVTPNLEEYIGVIATTFLKKILFMLTIYTQRSKFRQKITPTVSNFKRLPCVQKP